MHIEQTKCILNQCIFDWRDIVTGNCRRPETHLWRESVDILPGWFFSSPWVNNPPLPGKSGQISSCLGMLGGRQVFFPHPPAKSKRLKSCTSKCEWPFCAPNYPCINSATLISGPYLGKLSVGYTCKQQPAPFFHSILPRLN